MRKRTRAHAHESAPKSTCARTLSGRQPSTPCASLGFCAAGTFQRNRGLKSTSACAEFVESAKY
eukprot:1738905-Alexandrium_andersonii.AAC.1